MHTSNSNVKYYFFLLFEHIVFDIKHVRSNISVTELIFWDKQKNLSNVQNDLRITTKHLVETLEKFWKNKKEKSNTFQNIS